MLLAHHVERPDFLPDTSFAEKYLTIDSRKDAKSLGDTCLFVSGVFPNIGKRKGLNRHYYTTIGIGSYSSMYGNLFEELATHFIFLSDFIEVTIHSSKPKMNNLFH